jgi:tripartite-type tricarboxylate transporter receptor subunit TctC
MLLTLAATATAAPAYPVRPIKLIVPFPAGGGYDLVARTLAHRYTEAWGQPAIIDNRPGANGNIGAELAARSPNDGYTLLLGGIGPNALSPALYPRLAFDPLRDFEPVLFAATQQNLFVTHPSVPVKTVGELVKLAKSRPGELTYASTGSGSGQHLAAEQLSRMAGVRLVHVPYKGGPPALSAILGGEVTMQFNVILLPLPHVRAGRLTALGVASGSRSQAAPEIPTLAESGFAIDIDTWYGLYAPAGTPREVVQRLQVEGEKALAPATVREKLRAQGIDVVGAGPERLAAHNRNEIARWSRIARDARITLD